MHGQQKTRICDAKQTKQIHQYKNSKIKLYKGNAAIWHNKTCRITQLMPTCIWLNQLSNTTNLWWIDVYYIVINYMFQRLWPSSG